MLGFSQLLGGWTKWGFPVLSPGVFLLGFLPALILGGGILLGNSRHRAGARETVSGWAQDLGIEGFAQDMSVYQGAIAVAIGLVFSFVFDTADRGASTSRANDDSPGRRRSRLRPA